ncbi:hypothetical protein HOP50_13g70870 [Chloropicon primus]|uniref:Uncharacterized protein n=1 Tax=Chloropicon primus TaxID=1764295 RepID=A0A5B8MVJ0_9CHLO|nr:hypothetical protein A3770_13p70670 [Chloropicon primus]UPR03757.1 hypothetical protein HOP50_13g70870 [Chloropicon primus]|eukprot:QDZ24549.1 hypothetical protein A3770_13p70670 [Chloropicon primus]
MYQRPQANQSYSAYDANNNYAPLPTFGGRGDKAKKRKGLPLWANGKLLTYAPLAILAFILIWVMISHSRTITDLKERNQQLHTEVYKKERKESTLQKTALSYERSLHDTHAEKAQVQSKLNDALDKLKNLEDFFERHQHAHRQHAEEKDLWEKEKKFLHSEIESIRDNFRDTRQISEEAQQLQKQAEAVGKTEASKVNNPLSGGKASGDGKTEAASQEPAAAESDGASKRNLESTEDPVETDDGNENAKAGKDLTASIIKQFKHHRFSYGGEAQAQQANPPPGEVPL